LNDSLTSDAVAVES